jgi:3-deoxy-alpha-D-manno-octulosonate 8-oxidase
MSVNSNNNSKHVLYYNFGKGSIQHLPELVKDMQGFKLFIVDHYFQKHELIGKLPIKSDDILYFLDTTYEPKTSKIDDLLSSFLSQKNGEKPIVIIGIGGGSTLDTAKAIANLYTNPGKAEDYQGWDLVKNQAIYKIGIPTISGTGAESSRTCVMTNAKSGLKLGMNSDFTIYDQLILDPDLSSSVPSEQYFFTGMDTYIHCIESLAGSHRNAIGDAFSREALNLCREVFLSDDMMSDENRGKLMVASYLGGVAIANSYVGVVHPLSAGLSVVFGTHHCVANCIILNVLQEFYPTEYLEFQQMLKKQNIQVPKLDGVNFSEEELNRLYASSIIHEKPLSNALGKDFKSILSIEKVSKIFKNS